MQQAKPGGRKYTKPSACFLAWPCVASEISARPCVSPLPLTNSCLAFNRGCRIRKALENKANMEDDRTTALESQLGQAKQIAEEADKKYEEVRKKFKAKRNTIHF